MSRLYNYKIQFKAQANQITIKARNLYFRAKKLLKGPKISKKFQSLQKIAYESLMILSNLFLNSNSLSQFSMICSNVRWL